MRILNLHKGGKVYPAIVASEADGLFNVTYLDEGADWRHGLGLPLYDSEGPMSEEPYLVEPAVELPE